MLAAASPAAARLSADAPVAGRARCPAVEIPFRLDTDRGGIILDVNVNGRPATALLDTGAGHTVVSTGILRVAAALKPGRFAEDRPGFWGQRMWVWIALGMGRTDLGRLHVHVMDLAEVSRAYGRRVDALVGQDVLSRFDRVVLDFEGRRLHLIPRPEAQCVLAPGPAVVP